MGSATTNNSMQDNSSHNEIPHVSSARTDAVNTQRKQFFKKRTKQSSTFYDGSTKTRDFFRDYKNSKSNINSNLQSPSTNVKREDFKLNFLSAMKNRSNESDIETETNRFADNILSFAEKALECMNYARSKPREYSRLIQTNSNHLEFDKIRERWVFGKTTKIALKQNNPREAFEETALLLNSIEPARKLLMCEELCLVIPENNKLWEDEYNIKDLIIDKQADLKSRFSNFSFSMDIGISDASTCILLQITDDEFEYQRRGSILDQAYTHVGISQKKIEDDTCVYFLFATELPQKSPMKLRSPTFEYSDSYINPCNDKPLELNDLNLNKTFLLSNDSNFLIERNDK